MGKPKVRLQQMRQPLERVGEQQGGEGRARTQPQGATLLKMNAQSERFENQGRGWDGGGAQEAKEKGAF